MRDDPDSPIGRELTPVEMRSLVSRFTEAPGLLAVYLLGSAASGSMRRDSDVDLACLFVDRPPSAAERLKLAAEWGQGLSHPVDMGVISAANLVYTFQALMSGCCIYCRDAGAHDRRIATLLGLWAQFNHEREEVRHAYAMAG